MNRQRPLATHCACAHDMSIWPIQVKVTNVFRSNRSRKLRFRNGFYQASQKCLAPALIRRSLRDRPQVLCTELDWYIGNTHLTDTSATLTWPIHRQHSLDRYIGNTHLTDTSATLTVGADCGTIGIISNRWQLVTIPCRCFTMMLLTEFT